VQGVAGVDKKCSISEIFLVADIRTGFFGKKFLQIFEGVNAFRESACGSVVRN
jgi:hypothetical protein